MWNGKKKGGVDNLSGSNHQLDVEIDKNSDDLFHDFFLFFPIEPSYMKANSEKIILNVFENVL